MTTTRQWIVNTSRDKIDELIAVFEAVCEVEGLKPADRNSAKNIIAKLERVTGPNRIQLFLTGKEANLFNTMTEELELDVKAHPVTNY